MGLLSPKKDAIVQRHYFKEVAKLLGIRVKYYYPIYETATIHAEIKCQYSDAIDLDIVFQENPKVATLKAIGWVQEFKDDKPYIAMFPYDTPNLQTKSKIHLTPEQTIDEKGGDFEITSINTIFQYPDCYICTVVPIFDNDNNLSDIRNDYNTTGDESANYNHIDNDLEPDKYENGAKYQSGIIEATQKTEETEETSYFNW